NPDLRIRLQRKAPFGHVTGRANVSLGSVLRPAKGTLAGLLDKELLVLHNRLTRWRSGRDSNPRYGFAVCSLSSRAPSTTRPPLRTRSRTAAEFPVKAPGRRLI